MVLMRRGNRFDYVPDAFVKSFKENGYEEVCDEAAEKAASDMPTTETSSKTNRPKKKSGS